MSTKLKMNKAILAKLEEASEALGDFLGQYAMDDEMSEDGVTIEDPLNTAIAMIKNEEINNENVGSTS